MGFGKSALATLFLVMALFGSTMGTVYKVGDSGGWTVVGHVDYKKWASTKTFKVGDKIDFEYNPQFHNVLQVTHSAFQSCNTTSPITTWTSGNETFPIRRTGHFYFVCGKPGHCEAGQKVDIRVPKPDALITPAESPDAETTSWAPAPAPAKNSASSIHASVALLALVAVAAFFINNFAY